MQLHDAAWVEVMWKPFSKVGSGLLAILLEAKWIQMDGQMYLAKYEKKVSLYYFNTEVHYLH